MEKRYYTITEMVDMGFSRYELQCSTRIRGQTFATRLGKGRGATWRFNLEEYESFRKDPEKYLEQHRSNGKDYYNYVAIG